MEHIKIEKGTVIRLISKEGQTVWKKESFH